MSYLYRPNVFTGRMDIVAASGLTAGSWGSPSSVTISSGEVTCPTPGWYKIDTEGAAASDDLDTINGLNTGDEVLLSLEDASHKVVIKHGTGNFDLPGSVDITMNSLTDHVRMKYDGSNLVEASSRP